MLTKNDLISFEQDIADNFNSGNIRSPVHLYSGNEELMMEVFKDVNASDDWVCCTWRNHYQALLKGVPSTVLKEKIVGGKSMILNLPEYKFELFLQLLKLYYLKLHTKMLYLYIQK
jgi:hypothetical protein